MKYYLPVLLIILTVTTNAQKKDTAIDIGKYFGDAVIDTNTGRPLWQSGSLSLFEFENKRLPDTVRVIMLVCDTASFKQLDDEKIGLWPDKYLAYWMYGFSAGYKERYMNSHGQYEYYHVGEYYLDDKKKPLPKNIIVWMSKQLH